jgi:glycerophosphoryl diester phosphodiesterase
MPAAGRLLIEVKAVRDHTELVHDIGDREVWVQSFDARDLAKTAELSSRIPLAFLVETDDAMEAAFSLPYPSVHLEHVRLDAAMHRRLTSAGKAIGVWTVNAEADLRRVVGLGVDRVITDEPHLARSVVDEMCGPG